MFRKDIPGWLHSNEVSAIERLCSMAEPNTNIIEIGPFAGRTTQVIASLCKTNMIYAIDPWYVTEPPIVWEGINDYDGPEFDSNGVKDIFQKEIVDKHNNVISIQGQFPEDCPEIYNVSWIHWDTDTINGTQEIHKQLSYAWNLLGKNSVLSGHTFAYWMPSVVQAVREFANIYNSDIILPASGSIWYIKK
jgi:hypothetical protein